VPWSLFAPFGNRLLRASVVPNPEGYIRTSGLSFKSRLNRADCARQPLAGPAFPREHGSDLGHCNVSDSSTTSSPPPPTVLFHTAPSTLCAWVHPNLQWMATSRPGSARAHSSGVTGPQPRQPAASSDCLVPDSDSDPGPGWFDHLVTSPPLGPAHGHPTRRARNPTHHVPPLRTGPTRPALTGWQLGSRPLFTPRLGCALNPHEALWATCPSRARKYHDTGPGCHSPPGPGQGGRPSK
jgi:hypothetical protein